MTNYVIVAVSNVSAVILLDGIPERQTVSTLSSCFNYELTVGNFTGHREPLVLLFLFCVGLCASQCVIVCGRAWFQYYANFGDVVIELTPGTDCSRFLLALAHFSCVCAQISVIRICTCVAARSRTRRTTTGTALQSARTLSASHKVCFGTNQI